MAHVRRKLEATSRFPKGSWEVRWREPNPATGKLGWKGKTFGTKYEADRYSAALITDMERGEHVNSWLAKKPLGEVAEDWLVSLRDKAPATLHSYRSALANHVLPFWRFRPIGSITFADVNGWVADQAKVHGPPTVRLAYKVLRFVLAHGVRSGCLRSNPATGIELPRLSHPTMLFLDHRQVTLLADEVDRLWLKGQQSRKGRLPALPVPEVLPYGLVVKFAAYTGLRAGEIAGLQVKHLTLPSLAHPTKPATVTVDQKLSDVNGVLEVDEPKTKAGRRTVPIPAFLVPLLTGYLGDRRLQPESPVFIGAEGAMWRHRNFMQRYFRPARAALLPSHQSLRFHDLRHTFAAFLVAENVHPKEMQEVMGHSSITVTLDVYGHLLPNLGTRLGEALNAAFLQAHLPTEEAQGELLRLHS